MHIAYTSQELDWYQVKPNKACPKIGHGSYGQVFQDQFNEYPVAIKRTNIDPSFGCSSLNELDVSRRLYHPSLMNTFGIGNKTGKNLDLVMPLARDNLSNYIRKRTLKHDQVIKIFHDILTGVHFLHCNGILHMDLKLANILIFEDHHSIRAVVSDFGLAIYVNCSGSKILDRDLVTVTYRAPEIFSNGPRRYNTKVDIWSLGIILLRMFMVDDLFSKCSTHKQYKDAIVRMFSDNVRRSTLERLIPNVDNAILDLLERMLSIQPGQRPEISEILSSRIFSSYPIQPGMVCEPERKSYDGSVEDYYVVDKMCKIAYNNSYLTETVFLAIDLYHRTGQQRLEGRCDYKNRLLWIFTCLLIATKMTEPSPMNLSTLICWSEGLFNISQIQQLEVKIITILRGILYPRSFYTCTVNMMDQGAGLRLSSVFEILRNAKLYTNITLDNYLESQTQPGQPEQKSGVNLEKFRSFYPTTQYWKYMGYSSTLQCADWKQRIDYLFQCEEISTN